MNEPSSGPIVTSASHQRSGDAPAINPSTRTAKSTMGRLAAMAMMTTTKSGSMYDTSWSK